MPSRRCPVRSTRWRVSLNENPFPPLPAVRSALIESIDAANRYPEYLPQAVALLDRRARRMQLPFGMAITSAVAVAASYGADTQLRQRIQLITAERYSLRRRLRAMGIYSTDAHANFVHLPSAGRSWHEVFDPARLQVRHFADGGVRITIGTRDSTRAVLATVENAMA
jgi:histidinol-phosphate/aromatic aminotransferase/cobyric acid decarboxylase-like protein